MSKGSNRRPAQVDRHEFDRRWQETFGVSAETMERIWRPIICALVRSPAPPDRDEPERAS